MRTAVWRSCGSTRFRPSSAAAAHAARAAYTSARWPCSGIGIEVTALPAGINARWVGRPMPQAGRGKAPAQHGVSATSS